MRKTCNCHVPPQLEIGRPLSTLVTKRIQPWSQRKLPGASTKSNDTNVYLMPSWPQWSCFGWEVTFLRFLFLRRSLHCFDASDNSPSWQCVLHLRPACFCPTPSVPDRGAPHLRPRVRSSRDELRSRSPRITFRSQSERPAKNVILHKYVSTFRADLAHTGLLYATVKWSSVFPF